MTKDTGGQAFPRQESEHYHGMDGMTLRDYFAGQALASISGRMAEGVAELELKNNEPKGSRFAKYAYNIADAMIAERSKNERD